MSLISFALSLFLSLSQPSINGRHDSGRGLAVPPETQQPKNVGERMERERERGSARDGQRLKESGSDPKSSIILIPLAMSCESIILHLSFILALLCLRMRLLSGLSGAYWCRLAWRAHTVLETESEMCRVQECDCVRNKGLITEWVPFSAAALGMKRRCVSKASVC